MKIESAMLSWYLSKTTDKSRGFAIDPDILLEAHNVIEFEKLEAERILTVYTSSVHKWRCLPVNCIEKIIYGNNKMF